MSELAFLNRSERFPSLTLPESFELTKKRGQKLCSAWNSAPGPPCRTHGRSGEYRASCISGKGFVREQKAYNSCIINSLDGFDSHGTVLAIEDRLHLGEKTSEEITESRKYMKFIILLIGVATLLTTAGCIVSDGGRRGQAQRSHAFFSS